MVEDRPILSAECRLPLLAETDPPCSAVSAIAELLVFFNVCKRFFHSCRVSFYVLTVFHNSFRTFLCTTVSNVTVSDLSTHGKSKQIHSCTDARCNDKLLGS